ncbi:MAG TPA: Uma2 family endonuclease, partial [Pirellulales bacterium]
NFELHQGRFVSMSPTGRRHGNLQSRISAALQTQGEAKGHGEAFTETGVIIASSPDTVVGPDVAFVTKRKMPICESKEGYLQTIPELVVEIRSKNDSIAELNQKVADYLQAGVQLAWIVDHESNTVSEHRRGIEPLSRGLQDTLQCDDIIPGFRLPLADLFK